MSGPFSPNIGGSIGQVPSGAMGAQHNYGQPNFPPGYFQPAGLAALGVPGNRPPGGYPPGAQTTMPGIGNVGFGGGPSYPTPNPVNPGQPWQQRMGRMLRTP